MTRREANPAPGGKTVAMLQAALAAEQATAYGYGVLGAYLSGADAAQARADWIAHQVARDNLTETITAAGASPVPAAVAYELPIPVHSAAQARQLAVLLEDRVAQAYVGLVGVTDLQIRAFGAGQLRNAAQRAASWSHTTVAFPGLPPGALHAVGSRPAISAPG